VLQSARPKKADPTYGGDPHSKNFATGEARPHVISVAGGIPLTARWNDFWPSDEG
jgi:hypothetical protein